MSHNSGGAMLGFIDEFKECRPRLIDALGRLHYPKSGSWQVPNPSTRPLRGLLRANELRTHLVSTTKNRSC